MDNNLDEPFEALEKLFQHLINEAPEELYECLRNAYERQKIYISAPGLLISKLHECLIRKYNLQGEREHKFRGIEILPSSDYALTLFHEDYPIFKEDWMIHKIPLDPLFVKKQSPNVTKYVGQIKEFIPGRFGESDGRN